MVEHGLGNGRIDRGGFARLAIADQPDVIVVEDRDGADGQAPHHHSPVLGMEVHGSAGSLAPPFWSSSTEMLSGLRTKAMRPSRGGRLMVTPAAISRSHVA